MLQNRTYTLSDAAEVLKVKAELILRALAYLPALRQRSNRWTDEDLSQIHSVILTQIVPEMTGGKGVV